MPHFKLMTNLQKQAEKCIRCALGRGWGALRQAFTPLVLGGFLLLQAGASQAQPVLALSDDTPVILDARMGSPMWIAAGGQATIEQIATAGVLTAAVHGVTGVRNRIRVTDRASRG